MDFSKLAGEAGLNPMQLLQMVSKLGPQIPVVLEKLTHFLETKKKEYKIQSDEILFHSSTQAENGEFMLFGFVMKKDPENKYIMVVPRVAYKLNLSEQIEKLKSFIPET